jgi:hypothetical protein
MFTTNWHIKTLLLSKQVLWKINADISNLKMLENLSLFENQRSSSF